jgi:glutamate-1-semialdehyde 2,1-aminomutase
MTKVVAIIQARMGSTRLPNKVLSDLAGRPVLSWVVRAARAVEGVDEVVVATSTATADDKIADWCRSHKVACFRGSEQDVLSRFTGAAKAQDADIVMRITADCPFFDPAVGAQTLLLLRRAGADYACNNDPPNWPDGLDCEVVKASVLVAAGTEAVRPSDREHVMPFIRNRRGRFRIETLHCSVPGLAAERWTLDTPQDYEFLSAVAKRLKGDHPPSMAEVMAVLDAHPELRAINAQQVRDEGFAKSIAAEAVVPGRSYAGSQAMLERAQKTVPLGCQTFSKSHIQYPTGAAPLFVTHGNAGRVWDVDGNEYVDLVGGLLPNVLGYRDPDVDAAIREQLDRGISFSLATPLEAELSERLCRLIPCAEMVRFGKNGTDATSACIRLARAFTRRDRILMCGYHGWQDWYIGATTRNLGVPAAVSALSHLVPYNDLAAVERMFAQYPGEVAAIILEPAGANTPQEGFLQGLKDLAHRHGAVLVFDEVVTGFRWSLGGAQAKYNVTPDLAAFGKALGNGMPIAAVVGRTDIMRKMEDIFFSATFGGEALSLAAALAVLDKMEREPVIDRLWQTGGLLMEETRKRIASAGLSDNIGLVGSAPWAVLSYKDHAKAPAAAIKTLFLREAISCGVLVNASHNVCYAHDQADLARVLGAYEYALGEVRAALDAGNLMERLGNQIIQPVFQVRPAA